MILIQLKEPPLSLFVQGDYGKFIKDHSGELAPFASITNIKGKKGMLVLKANSNIAYIRESSDEEAVRATTPPSQSQIQPPGGMIIGRRGHKPN